MGAGAAQISSGILLNTTSLTVGDGVGLPVGDGEGDGEGDGVGEGVGDGVGVGFGDGGTDPPGLLLYPLKLGVGKFATGVPAVAFAMKSCQMSAGTDPPTISPNPSMLYIDFVSVFG